MKTDIKTTISASAGSEDYRDDLDDGLYIDYQLGLVVGDKEYALTGWFVAGWLAPGAHADLDGSGLANWGDSQPGGWSVCRTDGQSNGAVRVWGGEDSHDSPIRIESGEGGEDVEIRPEDIEEWQAAVDLVRTHEDDTEGDDYERAVAACEEIREQITQMLVSAIEAAIYCVETGEPDSEIIYDSPGMKEVDGMKDLPIRIGNWKGAGMVIVWQDDEGRYDHRYWPDDRDIERAIEETTGRAAEVIRGEIEYEMKRLNDRR